MPEPSNATPDTPPPATPTHQRIQRWAAVLRRIAILLLGMALGALGLSFLTGPFGQKSLGYILLVLSLIGLIAVVLFLVGRSVAVHYISRLQKAYQRAEIEDHAEDLVQWFAKPEARADLVQKHQEHLHDLARTAIALFGAARSLSLAVVVAGAVVGLATLFITYTQTELLDEQNERFDRQNTLLAFEQTSRLRQLLFRAPLDTSGTPVENYLTNYYIEDYRWPRPNKSIIEQIKLFARQDPVTVVAALRPLLFDEASIVASGALLALYGIDK